jgi:hypothetical protein
LRAGLVNFAARVYHFMRTDAIRVSASLRAVERPRSRQILINKRVNVFPRVVANASGPSISAQSSSRHSPRSRLIRVQSLERIPVLRGGRGRKVRR